MCTRFVCRGNDMITCFNFDIDLAVCPRKFGGDLSGFHRLHDNRRPDRTLYSGSDQFGRCVANCAGTKDHLCPGCHHAGHAVRQEGIWVTRVSFVYSAKEHTVYYVQNNDFLQIETYAFP